MLPNCCLFEFFGSRFPWNILGSSRWIECTRVTGLAELWTTLDIWYARQQLLILRHLGRSLTVVFNARDWNHCY